MLPTNVCVIECEQIGAAYAELVRVETYEEHAKRMEPINAHLFKKPFSKPGKVVESTEQWDEVERLNLLDPEEK
jgi:hypothetical protein